VPKSLYSGWGSCIKITVRKEAKDNIKMEDLGNIGHITPFLQDVSVGWKKY